MNYSLITRFEGALLGSTLGNILVPHQPNSESWQQNNDQQLSLKLLPLIMLSHENIALLKASVTQSNSSWQNSAEAVEDVLIWGYAISLALRDKLEFNNLIEQLLVGVGVKHRLLKQRLEIVNWALKRGKTLSEVLEKLLATGNTSQVNHALSLYCFGSIPSNFELATSLAKMTGARQRGALALTATLAGAYNGINGIPISWRMFSQQHQRYQKVLAQAQELFCRWSGVYLTPGEISPHSVVASPGSIQTRSSLNIISQDVYKN